MTFSPLIDVPKQLGKYEIRRVIGKGAMGIVHEGFDPMLAIAGKPSTTPLMFDGPWALFRFVDAGKVEGGTPGRQSASDEEGGKRIYFELRSSSVRNPMRLTELAQFRCPG